jgi:hypothetical protein
MKLGNKIIRLNFTDFDPGFDKKNNYFFHLLKSDYNIIIDEENPEYLIYSCFGTEYLKFNCIRIYYTGENDIPDFNLCDYALSAHFLDFNDRHKRFPNFMTYNHIHKLLNERTDQSFEEIKNKNFGNFIVSSTWAHPFRNDFYSELSNYKRIDSPGKVFNNIDMPRTYGNWHSDKLNFMKNYKFTICFENSSLPGYTTEKIVDAFVCRTLPIYWGNPLIASDFNPESFVNCHNFSSTKDIIDYIKLIDQDDSLYLKLINANPIPNEFKPPYWNPEFVTLFFHDIFQQSHTNAFRRSSYGFIGTYGDVYKNRVEDAAAYVNAVSGLKETVKLFVSQCKKRLYNLWN